MKKFFLIILSIGFGAFASPAAAQHNWRYETRTDEMRGATTWYAVARSNSSVNLGLPYGRTHLSIVVMKRPQDAAPLIMLTSSSSDAERGPQFESASAVGYTAISARFDDGPVIDIDGATSVGQSAAIVDPYDGAFAERLLGSRRVIIEVTFFREPPHQFVFDIVGLTLPDGVSFPPPLFPIE